ncbi:MAG: DUF2228 domain-containing protein, partial [Planctomycetes bacterium]|nr:DUF2228 domain-containing protein [Planctomycetota bacterium]
MKMDERASGVASLYDYQVLSADERERARQLRDIYGFEFPLEVFRFWRWHQGLSAPQQAAFADPLGLSLVGPFDVLAGKFDGVELAYPGVLHYRFADDPPEFVTVFLGEDGRRVGLWFDDHRRLAPVVAYYYRDDFTITALGNTVFDATRALTVDCDDGLVEMAADDPDYADEYAVSRRALGELVASLPRADERVPRPPALDTGDGMGVVPATIGGSAATEALLRGKRLWLDGPRAAGPVLEQAYRL